MSLARAAVKNPVAANLVMWFVVVVGLYFAGTLVREMFPNSQPEQISVTICEYSCDRRSDLTRAFLVPACVLSDEGKMFPSVLH